MVVALTFTPIVILDVPLVIIISAALLVAVFLIITALFLMRTSKKERSYPTVDAKKDLHSRSWYDSQNAWHSQVSEASASNERGVKNMPDPIQQSPWQGNDPSSPSQPQAAYTGKCPNCGLEVQPEDLFCLRCGSRLPLAVHQSSWPPQQPAAASNATPPPPARTDEPARDSVQEISELPTLHGEVMPPLSQHANGNVERPARLALRSYNGDTLQEYPLDKSEIVIGRSSSCDITLPKDKLASRRHAIVRYENGRYLLSDLQSANGTFVNGQQLEETIPRVLQEGDTIGIGAYEFVFHAPKASSSLIEDLPTVAIANSEAIFRTREEELAPASASAPPDEWLPLNPVPGALVSPARSTAASPASSLEQVCFTAFHPKEVPVGEWQSLLVYAYIEPVLDTILKDVELFRREIGEAPRRSSGMANQLLPRDINITIVPECRGILFNPKRITFKWVEDWHRCIFRFFVKNELAGLARNGKVNIFAGPLLVASLKMAMLFEEQPDSARDNDARINSHMYKKIFASYSHHDTPVVRACRDMYQALGFDFMMDVDKLRSGQIFDEALRRMIDQAEIFQLFWSASSARSAYVKTEWEYALELNKGEGFVRPIYWEVPLVPPPDTLAPLHFSYLPTYTFGVPSSSSPS